MGLDFRSAFLVVSLGMTSWSFGSQDHWAYQPLGTVDVPEVSSTEWQSNPIDAFIYRKLEANGLEPNPQASKLALIRRAYYDLIGLPPSPQQVKAFLTDDAPDAYERLIEELLASPHYGEKWGRHWLDLVRWAESNGYERDSTKPLAWKYRDYVIDAFNQDKPFNQFILEQLAGDVIENPTTESLVATGIYRLGLWDDEPADKELSEYEYYDDIVNTFSRTFLASSMSCARCHDHKVDPFTAKDYYSMVAFVRDIRIPYRREEARDFLIQDITSKKQDLLDVDLYELRKDVIKLRLQQWEKSLDMAVDEAETASSISEIKYGFDAYFWDYDTFDEFVERYFDVVGNLEAGPITLPSQIANISRSAGEEAFAFEFQWNVPESGQYQFDIAFQGAGAIYVDENLIFSKNGINRITGSPSLELEAGLHPIRLLVSHTKEVELRFDFTGPTSKGTLVDSQSWRKQSRRIHKWVTESDPDTLDGDSLAAYQEAREKEVSEQKKYDEVSLRYREEMILGVSDEKEKKSNYILERGSPHLKGDPVERAFPAVLLSSEETYLDAQDDHPRLALAKWIASEQNPLTARVAANRIWQHHFGRGLARSGDEFGGLGTEPTHPELLDWLAGEFIRQGWKRKPLHRLIMTSKAYRMSSRANEYALQKDPLNDAFWRFDMRRLTAEEIRDSVLAVTDSLDLVVGGESVFPRLSDEVLATASRPRSRWDLDAGPEHQNRRSLYTFTRRSLLDPNLSLFDMADTDSTCAARFNTTVPSQALAMMNSEFIEERARDFARIISQGKGDSLESVIEDAFSRVTGRQPDLEELTVGLDLIASLQQDIGHSRDKAVERFALMILNLNEFIYLD